MPKIIFRPNPVPPPFPPPTPIYPENSISFSPMPFNVGQNVVGTFHKVLVPEGHTIFQVRLNLPEGKYPKGYQSTPVSNITDLNFDGKTIQFVSEFSSSDLVSVILETGIPGEMSGEIELTWD